MTMITPSYLGETIEYSSLHACRSTLEDPTNLDFAQLSGDGLFQFPNLGLVRHINFENQSFAAERANCFRGLIQLV